MSKYFLELSGLLCLLVMACTSGFGQSKYFGIEDEGLLEAFPPSFSNTFGKDGQESTFSRLRQYLDEKQLIKDRLEIRIAQHAANLRYDTAGLLSAIKFVDSLITNPKMSRTEIVARMSSRADGYFDRTLDSLTVRSELRSIRNRLTSDLGLVQETSRRLVVLRKNLKVIDGDIRDATDALETKYRLEKAENSRIIAVSIVFGVIIAGLLGGFFFVMLYRKETKLAEVFLSGYGLQFVALFALIICIGMFGVLKIIPGAELATMLGAIAGFILGKGTIDASSNVGQAALGTAGATAARSAETSQDNTTNHNTTTSSDTPEQASAGQRSDDSDNNL